MQPYRNFLLIFLLLFSLKGYGQQDVDFHLNWHFLTGKTILKVKRDFGDPYLWVLAKNNAVYRVNSLTKVVDDYSGQFSPYNNQQFIDIAGQSKDIVFIATATSIIIYQNGALSTKTAADGLLENVNSIGISYKYDNLINNILRIGTDKGLCDYDFLKDVLTPYADSKYAYIFEATYRREMYSDYGLSSVIPDYVYPVLCFDQFNIYGDYIFKTGVYGDHISAAFYTTGTLYPGTWGSTVNFFWATEKGLFQIDDAEGFGKGVYDHYLDNVKINKITDIYGLTSFGNAYTKENLLVSTAQGLYFSNSLYQAIPYNGLDVITMYHYDELGNIPVNDICVNAASTQNPICEDGVWLATNDGLYLIKPDYAKFNNSQKLTALHFENKTTDVSEMDICTEATINAVINYDVTTTSIQWYKDGKELPAETGMQMTIKNGGDYNAVLYDPCGDIHLETNHLKVNVIQPPVFTFNYPDELRYCTGTPVILKAEGSPNYQYRWYKDEVLTGDVTASLNITQSGKYKVEVSACEGSWVPSKEVQVDLISLPIPVVTADKPNYCIGDRAVLSVAVPVDPGYTINWYKDNVLLTDNTNQVSLTTAIDGSYTVSVINNLKNSDGTTCTQISTPRSILFNLLPTVSIQKIVNTTLCDGQTVDLKVNYSGGTIKWSTGETADQISVSTPGNYKVTVTSPAGCTTDANVDVAFFPNPVLNIPDAGVCVPSHKNATLTAPAGLASYTWNGKTGTETYIADHPQTVNLIVTDANGCIATQEINITDECPNINIPNTFTPNGDGINDTWNIVGLNYDPTCLVQVFTRYGQKVFVSRGYGTPWNGEYGNKKLVPGTYYYIITAKGGTLRYSGSVTVIY